MWLELLSNIIILEWKLSELLLGTDIASDLHSCHQSVAVLSVFNEHKSDQVIVLA